MGKEEYDEHGRLVMSRRALEDSIFEMADLWCISVKLSECVGAWLVFFVGCDDRWRSTIGGGLILQSVM